MRNLLLLLLLANVLFFLWEQFVSAPDDTGIAIVSEQEMGPTLELADANESPLTPEPAPADATDDPPGDATDAGDTIEGDDGEAINIDDIEAEPESETVARAAPRPLEATVGRSCISLGPFRDRADAEAALADQEGQGLTARLRATQGEVFLGHWVQIRNIPDRATANDMLQTLQGGGLGEAYVVETDDEGIKISLGLFGDIAGAERTELQAKSLDLPAEITERMRDATVFYVDLALPPGRGAGNMIDRYGEERVQLRDAATCPRGG
ncbi:MAG: SPOR domain-containing protein [Woeseiaceae bacterium]|nr:SPOR domain-containing protein [Woeseiaceae bacterium]